MMGPGKEAFAQQVQPMQHSWRQRLAITHANGPVAPRRALPANKILKSLLSFNERDQSLN
jgi:hypothetical protein